MKKSIKIYSLIVLLSLITSSNILIAQANIDSIFKSYQLFLKPSSMGKMIVLGNTMILEVLKSM